jgi:hypothetical protein
MSGAIRYRFRLSLFRIGPRHDLATLNQFIKFREAKIFGPAKTLSIGHQTAHN